MEPTRPARVERRLAAILVVAAYSRLMGADEEGTLERLKAPRRDFVDPKLTAANSREEGRRSGRTPPHCR
jgi:adenylate cyclase